MSVQCEICPRRCKLDKGESGNCLIRKNVDEKLVLTTYGYPCATHVDPVEKKPLFHFMPGTKAYSVATAGCNLHCKNCQNWEISQSPPDKVPARHLPPKELVKEAKKYNCKSIAYTYTDPVVFFEYAYDTSAIARKEGIKNILVTAGYINKEPMKVLCKNVDAANIDLKAYSDKFYRDVCRATLKPVLEALVTTKSCGVMVEVTNLLIPTLNDSDKDITELVKWVKANMGKETPLHFSRFFPNFRMRNLPATSINKLKNARKIALAEGLEYVYIGNVPTEEAESTFCPFCKELLIQRSGYSILKNQIQDGKCSKCKNKIYGVWK